MEIALQLHCNLEKQAEITHPIFFKKSFLSRWFIEYPAFYVRLYKRNY